MQEEELWRKAYMAAYGEELARARGDKQGEWHFQERKERYLCRIDYERRHTAWLAEKARRDAADDETRAAMEAAYEQKRREPVDVDVRGMFEVPVALFDELERRYPKLRDLTRSREDG